MDPFSNLLPHDKISENVNTYKFEDNEESFPPEPQNGNVEYKLKIIDPTQKRFEHLVSQMKWRLQEGNGEAIYEIGVDDRGILQGLSEEDLEKTLHVLGSMAEKLKATTKLISKRKLSPNRSIVEVQVKRISNDRSKMEIRIAVLGNADAGKSTLLGVLTQGSLDTGKGRARLNMFRHLHEIKSGRTSSISHEILGFGSDGSPINYSDDIFRRAEDICEKSSKLVNFLDLAGHRKYLRTTIHGLSGYIPHYTMLVISSSTGAIGMTQEHLVITRAMKLPFFAVVTKIDIVPAHDTVIKLKNLLQEVGSRKDPLVVNNQEDVLTAISNQDKLIPIFCISNVTGEGIPLLTSFLSLLSLERASKEEELLELESPIFQIDEIFNSIESGQLIAGLLKEGSVAENQVMQIGPFPSGNFKETTIKSIHCNRVCVSKVRPGQSAVFKLNSHDDDIRKGMVLLSIDANPSCCLFFQAYITVIHHTSGISPGFQVTVHINNIRQTASIVRIYNNKYIQTNESDYVMFKFKRYPEYVTIGQKLFFRAGFSKGIGEITEVFPFEYQESPSVIDG